MMVKPLAKEGSESMTLIVAGATSNAASFLIATGSGSLRTSTSLKWVMLLLFGVARLERKETEDPVPSVVARRAAAAPLPRRMDAGVDMVVGMISL
jgi:hypothetical protein